MWWEHPRSHVDNHGLKIEGLDAKELAEEYGTPLYVYTLDGVRENYRRFKNGVMMDADREIRICYAMKANSNPSILECLREEGAGLDTVSPAEVERGAGAEFENIIFTGVSVSEKDFDYIMRMVRFTRDGYSKIIINIDTERDPEDPETTSDLEKLRRVCDKHGCSPPKISFRMDPGIPGAGHSWKTITAGKEAHGVPIKFGIPASRILDAYRHAVELGFYPVGIHEHIGSNWRTEEEVKEFLQTVGILLEKAGEVTEFLERDLDFANFGGGPGIRYKEEHPEFPLQMYAEGIWERVKKSGLKFRAVTFEPGRYIVGNSGWLLTTVNTIKRRYGDLFAGVDAGFNVLLRPAMYDSHHEIVHTTKADMPAEEVYTIVGNLCETGDVLSQDPVKRLMSKIKEGDVLAIHNAGAYGFSMSSVQYNLRGYPPTEIREVVVEDGKAKALYIDGRLQKAV